MGVAYEKYYTERASENLNAYMYISSMIYHKFSHSDVSYGFNGETLASC